MLHKLLSLLQRYREIVLYLLFGGLTTLINIVTYFFCARLLPFSSTIPANTLAWLLSVLFAYATNRRWVFASRAAGLWRVTRELFSFFGARVFTGLLDIGILFLFVDCLRFYDLPVKIASNLLVIVINYLLSKFWIFRKNHLPTTDDGE